MKEYNYLGCKITSDGWSCNEKMSRIDQAEVAFNKIKNLFTYNNINLKIRINSVIAYVWCVVLWEEIMDMKKGRKDSKYLKPGANEECSC